MIQSLHAVLLDFWVCEFRNQVVCITPWLRTQVGFEVFLKTISYEFLIPASASWLDYHTSTLYTTVESGGVGRELETSRRRHFSPPYVRKCFSERIQRNLHI
jgi:hypothetical protein